MKLAVVTLVRNEIDIIATFLRHLDALADYALLMDHGSIDGTSELIDHVCTKRDGWTRWHVEPAGYHQGGFSIFALQHLIQHTDADVILFLDADEFINATDRASLEASLAALLISGRLGLLRWRNTIPEHLETRTIVPREVIWRAPSLSRLGKVVISRRFLAENRREIRLGPGNHVLWYGDEQAIPSDPVGELLHLPIRSHAQMRTKVLTGVFATMARAARDPAQSWHWYDMLWRIADGTLSDADLTGIAAHYSEPDNRSPEPLATAALPAHGFTRSRLEVAFGRELPELPDPPPLDPVRLVATILRRFKVEDERENELYLDGDRLRFKPRASPA